MAYQANCNKQGFNLPNDIWNQNISNTYNKFKLGIGMNNQNDCGSCDTAIGIGIGRYGASNLCDNGKDF